MTTRLQTRRQLAALRHHDSSDDHPIGALLLQGFPGPGTTVALNIMPAQKRIRHRSEEEHVNQFSLWMSYVEKGGLITRKIIYADVLT